MANILDTIGDSLLAHQLISLYSVLQTADEAGAHDILTGLQNLTALDLTNLEVIGNLTPDQISQIKDSLVTVLAQRINSLTNVSGTVPTQSSQIADPTAPSDTQLARQLYLEQSHGYSSLFVRNFLALFQPLLALALLGFGMAYIWRLSFYPVPESSLEFSRSAHTFVMMSVVGAIMAFFFGGTPTTIRTISGILRKSKDQKPDGIE